MMQAENERNATIIPLRRNNILFYTGISGSGKDYLLSGLISTARYRAIGIQIINFGEMLYERLRVVQSERGLSSRDDIKRQMPDYVKTYIDELTEEIIDRQPVVVNTHLAYKQNGSIQINQDVIKKLAPIEFVYVHAEPRQIKKWRESDLTRNRDSEDEIDIAVHQRISLAATQTFASSYGSRLQILYNGIENTEKNLDLLYHSIDQLYVK